MFDSIVNHSIEEWKYKSVKLVAILLRLKEQCSLYVQYQSI